MCKFIGKSNERILCKLTKRGILKLYSIVCVAMETTKTSNFTCQSKSFISIFFTCQVSACELQPFSCHDLANEYTHKLPKLCSATLNTLLSPVSCTPPGLPPQCPHQLFNMKHAEKLLLYSCTSWWNLGQFCRYSFSPLHEERQSRANFLV